MQTKLAAAEEEASQKLVQELVSAEMEEADEKTKKHDAKYNLATSDVLKQKQEQFDEKKKKDNEAFLKHLANRSRSEKIIGVQANVVQQGKSINVVLMREGLRNTQAISGIQRKSLVATEWIEVYDLIKNRTSANMIALHKMITGHFDHLRKFETKFDIEDSFLKNIDTSAPSSKKQKTVGAFSFTSDGAHVPSFSLSLSHSPTLPAIEGDELLNASLPSGIYFEE